MTGQRCRRLKFAADTNDKESEANYVKSRDRIKYSAVVLAALMTCIQASFGEGLVPGDLVYIDTYNTPELSTTAQVDEGGQIELPYVGLVRVSGLNETEAAAAVAGAYTSVHKNPRVTISKTVMSIGGGSFRTSEMRTEVVELMNADAGQLAQTLLSHTSEGGSITYEPNTNILLVTDTVGNLQNILAVISKLDQMQSQLHQVQIEAKIAEVKIGALKELGVRWFVQGDDVSGGYYPNAPMLPGINGMRGGQASPIENERIGGSGNQNGSSSTGRRFANDAIPDRLLGLPIQVPKPGQLFLGFMNSSIDLGMLIDALAADDQAEILANPNLLTVNHKPAEIRMTDEVPFTEFGTEVSGRGNFSVKFLDIGIIMTVTPHVLRDDHGTYVKLDMEPRVSFASGVRNGVPVRSMRSYSGQANVRDRQTLVIGGIYRNDTRNIESRVPVVSKIPVLGNLFKHKESQREQTELVIFVTPHVHERPDTVTWDRMLNLTRAAEVATKVPDVLADAESPGK